MWISKYRILDVTDKIALRVRPLVNAVIILAGVVVLHTDLLHLPKTATDLIELGCLVILSFNHSVKE